MIAQALDYTPEYVTMLQRQPLIREYIKEMNEAVSLRLEAMFDKTVDVISDQMTTGNGSEKLAAARLHLEATKRIGRIQADAPMPQEDDRLERLAQRLESLLNKHKGVIYDAQTETVIE